MAGFAGMAISARELHTTMSTFEILFFRSLIGVLVVLPFIMRNRFRDLRTTKFRFTDARWSNFRHSCAGCTASPPNAVGPDAIEFTVPVFTAVLAVMFLGETMWRHKWTATLLGSSAC